MEIGERCEIYDCALEGEVKTEVRTNGEAEAAIMGAWELTVTWLAGSWVGGEWIAR